MRIRWDCKRQGCYKDMLPDWSMLKGCFHPYHDLVSDLDGYTHQNGRFLFLEKKFPDAVLEPPAMRAFRSMVAQGNAAIIIWCEKADGSDISAMRVFGLPGYNSEVRVTAKLEDFRDAVKQWWKATYVPGKM
jgi:hypothetical protein